MIPTIPLFVSANERMSFLRNRKNKNLEKKMRNEKEAFLRRLLCVKQKERHRMCQTKRLTYSRHERQYNKPLAVMRFVSNAFLLLSNTKAIVGNRDEYYHLKKQQYILPPEQRRP